jgi:hypothetical protein
MPLPVRFDAVWPWRVAFFPLFTFLAVAVYADSRLKERVSMYRHETLKKLADSGTEGAERVLEAMREKERLRRRRMLEGLKLGGLVTTAAGAGLGIFLYALDYGQPPGLFLVGLIPLGVGLALLVYAVAQASKPD